VKRVIAKETAVRIGRRIFPFLEREFRYFVSVVLGALIRQGAQGKRRDSWDNRETAVRSCGTAASSL